MSPSGTGDRRQSIVEWQNHKHDARGLCKLCSRHLTRQSLVHCSDRMPTYGVACMCALVSCERKRLFYPAQAVLTDTHRNPKSMLFYLFSVGMSKSWSCYCDTACHAAATVVVSNGPAVTVLCFTLLWNVLFVDITLTIQKSAYYHICTKII